jgi:hypothetical protein
MLRLANINNGMIAVDILAFVEIIVKIVKIIILQVAKNICHLKRCSNSNYPLPEIPFLMTT